MDRRSTPPVTLTVPELEDFDEDEQLLAQAVVGMVRGGGTMFYGRFLECVVARILGASFPLFGISPWDLVLADGP